MDPYDEQSRKRKLVGVVLLGIIGLILLAIITYVATDSGTPKPNENTGTTATGTTPDTSSSATSTDSNNSATNDNEGTIEDLKDYGLSSQQVSALQAAAYNFAASNNKDIKKLAISKEGIEHTSSTSGQEYKFTLNFGDDKDYRAKMLAISIVEVRLYLTDQSAGKQVYDSKIIDYTGQITGQ